MLKKYYFLVFIVFLSFGLRLLWLNAVIEGDEGFYGYEAMLWYRGRLPYIYATPTKMPLLYILYLIPIHFFGNTIIPIRMLNNILFLISLIVLYFIAKSWYGKKVGFISVFFYGIFMNLPVFQAHQAMSEALSAPFIIFSIYFYNEYLENGRKIVLVVSGISVSAALLINQGQAMGIIALLLMVKFTKSESHGKCSETKLRRILVLLLGVFLPILIVVIYFWSQRAMYNLVERVLISYFLRIEYFYPVADFTLDILFLILAEGLPLWLFCISGFIACYLRLNKYDKLSIIWMLCFLGLALIPPFLGHHFTFVMAPTSLLAGLGFSSINNYVKLRPLRNFLSGYRQNIKGMLVVFILVLSLVPSIYFANLQYPNLHIHWRFVHFDYAGAQGPWTYEKQLEVGNFLKSNTSEDSKILIHDLWATPYWLSGHIAPSRYISTTEIFTIPEEEFQRLADMVKNREFEYVVIISEDLESLEERRDDPIVNYTLDTTRYLHVKTILNAQIFSVNTTLTS